MTRGLGGSLLPYRVRDFHSLFLASFPGARSDPDKQDGLWKEVYLHLREQLWALDLIAFNSAGGIVSLPMQDMFWGSYFGSFTDNYGINWQINFDAQQE